MPARPARSLRILLLSLVTTAIAAASGCGPVMCTAEYVYGLSITVVDGAGERVCDATVVARDGEYEETLESFGPAEDCTYVGAGERAGTYEVTASRPGDHDAVESDIVVDDDVCHVSPQARTITLEALPIPG